MLAASSSQSGLFSEILLAAAGLLVTLIIGAIVITVIRRATQADSGASAPFTLQDLRDMHARGDLTDEEFERAKAEMLKAFRPPSTGDNQADDDSAPDNAP